MSKRLYRSTEHKVIGGVCGGLGDYFDLDPALLRIFAVLLFFASGVGFFAYLIAWVIIPVRPYDVEVVNAERESASWHKYLPGLFLIGIGLVLLLRESWYWFDMGIFWPGLLVVGGLWLIFSGRKKTTLEEPHGAAGEKINGTNGGTI
ncbi:MAG: PspC domain-containing protein [candidate division Zixibacteria bacterium]|nr:PspC domain-containing protein [candidate division Zixibacteria bacterium]